MPVALQTSLFAQLYLCPTVLIWYIFTFNQLTILFDLLWEFSFGNSLLKNMCVFAKYLECVVIFLLLISSFISHIWRIYSKHIGFSSGSDDKAYACNVRDPGSIPWLGRSPGEGSGNLLKYSCLENPIDREPGGLQSMGSQKVRHDWATISLSFFSYLHVCLLHSSEILEYNFCSFYLWILRI